LQFIDGLLAEKAAAMTAITAKDKFNAMKISAGCCQI